MEGTERCCTATPSSWDTPTPAWWVHWHGPGNTTESDVISFLCCSTWAAWPRPGRWRISWLLTSVCRRTPQVALVSKAGYCTHIPDSEMWLCVIGEACWWTIHPASKQRSEGEKVRVGDDLILVSVSSERYLVTIIYLHLNSWCLLLNMILFTHSSAFFSQHLSYASGDLMVDASFMQTLWTMTPVMSGCELAEGWHFCFCTNLKGVHKPLRNIDIWFFF